MYFGPSDVHFNSACRAMDPSAFFRLVAILMPLGGTELDLCSYVQVHLLHWNAFNPPGHVNWLLKAERAE
jgi:hypothetical protein